MASGRLKPLAIFCRNHRSGLRHGPGLNDGPCRDSLPAVRRSEAPLPEPDLDGSTVEERPFRAAKPLLRTCPLGPVCWILVFYTSKARSQGLKPKSIGEPGRGPEGPLFHAVCILEPFLCKRRRERRSIPKAFPCWFRYQSVRLGGSTLLQFFQIQTDKDSN